MVANRLIEADVVERIETIDNADRIEPRDLQVVPRIRGVVVGLDIAGVGKAKQAVDSAQCQGTAVRQGVIDLRAGDVGITRPNRTEDRTSRVQSSAQSAR